MCRLLLEVVRLQGLEGVIAKRRNSSYRPGDRSGDWIKLRADRRQDLVIGGYVPNACYFHFNLVGYYQGRDLMYAVRIRAGFAGPLRQMMFSKFVGWVVEGCPFQNLPERSKGRWGDALTAAEMEKCRCLKPELVAAIEFLVGPRRTV